MKTKIVIIAVAVLISACGGGGGSSENPPVTGSSSSSVSSTPTADFCPATQSPKNSWAGYSQKAEAKRILVFSKTAGFRHDSIAAGQSMLQNLAASNGWTVELTENSADFTSENLARFNVVVWLNTTGNVLQANEQVAFESYIENGGGYLGIHSAADTEHDWPWYENLVGAYFKSHPHNQTAELDVEHSTHPATLHLGETWTHFDEWYNYQTNPRDKVNVLLSLDESSYAPGNDAAGDHPIAWYHNVGAGRAFYSGLGHTNEAYSNPDFIAHIKGGLIWAGRMDAQVEAWEGPPPPDSDFSTTYLAVGINQPMALQISTDHDFYVIGRRGEFYALENGELKQKSFIPTNSADEGGLIGFALDPDFARNRHAYFHYTDNSLALQHVARITLNSDNTLNFNTEKKLISYGIDFGCCHVAGDMAFDSAGILYIATGDNTNPFESNGYTPIDERPGRAVYDAQRTSANTNDMRGKILRIKPTEDGGYTIPAGNLFSTDELHRGEIFTMGHRNPFRIAIDPRTDWLFWGDVGPDANLANPLRGPGGYDEVNKTAVAGNFGWPYFAGNNDAYNNVNFATNQAGAKFNPVAVVNMSVNNTGANALPNAIPAWITLSHRALMLGDVYRWNNEVQDTYKLPSYFNGRLLFWNFNNDAMLEADVTEAQPIVRNWLDTSLLAGIIDGEISPVNNRLYLLAYGGNCCDSPANAGMLAEVRYIGDGPQEPEQPIETFVPGDTVTFSYDGKVVSAATAGALALLDNSTGNSEIFEIIDAGAGTVALRSSDSGLYVTAGSGGTQALAATADAIGLEQRFELIQNFDGSYLLKAVVNCRYVSVTESAGAALVANALTAGSQQTFSLTAAQACTSNSTNGVACRPTAPPFLNMPHAAGVDFNNLPGLLSQTGAFADVSTLTPAASLIPYELIAPLWSDRAEKIRWVAVPSGGRIGWAETGKWQWPAGTVFVKHFELPVDTRNPNITKRLETRLLVVQQDGGVYGATYKWRDDNADADLLRESLAEEILVSSTEGDWIQTWNYPSPADCLTCHNPEAKGVLGVKTASLNKSWTYPSGVTDNQLRTWIGLGIFDTEIDEHMIEAMPAHAALTDSSKTREHRLRSYWDINCSNCHGPQGIASLWDGRYETPLAQQGVINGALAGQRDYFAHYGLTAAKVVDPGNKENSIMYIRSKSIDPDDRMPPLGSNLADTQYLNLFSQWIESVSDQ